MTSSKPTDSIDQLLWAPVESGADRAWYLLQVKSRQEKQLAATLASMRVGHYLPLVRRARYWGARKVVANDPLFPGYLFLRGAADDVYRADRTRRVARFSRVADQRRLDWELRNIRLALGRDAALDPYPFLHDGMRVEVRSGAFRGLQGMVSGRHKDNRLVLQVNLLGTAASLEIDGTLLDPLE
jgi:transcription antitermination factor NusG